MGWSMILPWNVETICFVGFFMYHNRKFSMVIFYFYFFNEVNFSAELHLTFSNIWKNYKYVLTMFIQIWHRYIYSISFSYTCIMHLDIALYVFALHKMYFRVLQSDRFNFSVFSFSCVGVQEYQAIDIEIYHCPKCQLVHGPLVCKFAIFK